MATITIPYGQETITVDIPQARLAGVLESNAHRYRPEAGEEALVRRSLEQPIGSPRLRDLARGRDRVVIITSDHTRPVPTRIIAPLLLGEIRSGNPAADVTFLVATGFHRGSTPEELERKFGPQMLRAEKIVLHDCFDDAAMVPVGRLPSGGDLVLNRLAMEADLLVAEGFIEPHLFAGFSGGRKSVLPGIASKVTVLANHCAEFIAHDKARPGILEGNPIHIDMVHAARQARLDFIANVVIDSDKRIIHAVAGHRDQAHLAGCAFAAELAAVEARPADIVIATNGGYPLDQNVYQHVKALTSAEATCRSGGVIIVCAALSDGHGSEDLYQGLKSGAREIYDRIMGIDRDATIPDQWATQIMARVLLRHTVVFVTRSGDHRMIEDMGFRAVSSLEQALRLAESVVGSESRITVIPDGVSVIVR